MKELKNMIPKKNMETKLMIRFQQALKDKDFEEFVNQTGLSYEVLAQYTSILEESKKEYEHCKNCKSILECKNKINGYCYLPESHNHSLSFCYQKCRYQKELDDKNQYLNNVYTFDIPEEIRHASISDIYKDDKNRYQVIKYITVFIKDYLEKKNPKGMYLTGNFGAGKTHLISAMFNELAKKNVKSSIVFWPEYLRQLKNSFNNHDEFKEKFEQIKESPILLIDDIGAENMTSWGRDEVLCPILQYRMEEHLPTFFTSNLNLEQLEQHLSITKDGVSEVKARRIIERIKQLSNQEIMISKNLRS